MPASSIATAMPAPIVPPPTTPAEVSSRGLRAFVSGALATSRSAKTHGSGRRAAAVDTLQEQRALQAQAFIEGQIQRSLDRFHDLVRGENRPRLLAATSTRQRRALARFAARSASPCASRVRRTAAPPAASSSCA